MSFVDREEELRYLRALWDGPGAALVIVYGRRRVGKTELLRVFGGALRKVFFVATQSSAAAQLRSFAEAAREGLGVEAEGVSFADWEGALRFVGARARRERTLVVLDEFPYLVDSEPALPSLLQKAWDQHLREGQVVLVLCGSSISFMESETLAHKSPLFGRRTGQYLVEPLGYREAGDFFPNLPADERLQRYAVLGGLPAYLLQFRPVVDLWENIRTRILEKGTFLRDEVPFLLMQELREPRLYLAILTAMAEGRTRLGEISQRALGPGESNRAAFYLQTLQDLRLVERRVPVTEERPHKSRKGTYVLRDPFVRFWLRFVFEEASALEAGRADQVVEERIRPAWEHFVAPLFEEVCREFVRRPPLWLRLPFQPAAIGSWWSRAEEIDLVALDHSRRRLLCGECKWSTRRVGTNVLDDLRRRARTLAAEISAEGLHLALFSRSGFTREVLDRAEAEGVLLVGVDDLYRRS